jgi:hypothetical protein
VFGDNGAPIQNYFAVIRSNNSTPTCKVTGVENGTPSVDPPDDAQWLDSGTTATDFGGLSANQPYTIWIFAYNGQGCTPAGPVQVIPRAVPGDVSDISTARTANGDDNEYFDFRLDSFVIASGSTDADMFMYRFVAGADGSESPVVDLGSFLVAGSTQYGNNVTVEVKACRAYPEATLCSADWSVDFPLGVPVHNSTPGGLVFEEDSILGGGNWSWTSIPAGAYDTIEYRCDSGGGESGWLSPMPDIGQCDAGLLARDLRVRITANGITFPPRSYDASNF